MTTELDVLASQALGITTAAAMLDNAARTVGALCSGVERHGFDREGTRAGLAVLDEIPDLITRWIDASEPPGGNLDGLDRQIEQAAYDLGRIIEDIGTALAYGGDPPDDWPDRLDDIGNQIGTCVRKVQAALTLADAPINGSN